MKRFGIIILAAGSSSRLGKSKQLLEYKGASLLERTVNTATNLDDSAIVVVLGANAREHHAAITHLGVDVVENPRWESGMGSSIKSGLKYLTSTVKDLQACIILVCDQPFLSTSHLRNLVASYESSQKPITASFYGNEPGVPALFDKSFFPILLSIDDHAGAKQIIKQDPTKVALEFFEKGSIDIDTPDDYEKLKKHES